jgi:hypothetical protein
MRETAVDPDGEALGENIPVLAEREAFGGLERSRELLENVPDRRAASMENLPPKNRVSPEGTASRGIHGTSFPSDEEFLGLTLSGKTSKPVGEGPSCSIF